MADDGRLLELVEAEAFADLFRAAPVELAEEHGIASVDLGAGAVCTVAAGMPSLMLNRVIGLGVGRPASSGMLDLVEEAFGETRYLVAVAPDARPPELVTWLRGRGFEPGYAWMKFRRGPEPAESVATDLVVSREDDGVGFARAVAEGYGMPAWIEGWLSRLAGRAGWHCFVARAGREPAAGGAVFIQPPAAWLGIAGTSPRFRRRGGQAAVMAARVAAAVAAGCTLLVTETGERVDDRASTSYGNILRAGFREAYVRPNYASAPADAVA